MSQKQTDKSRFSIGKFLANTSLALCLSAAAVGAAAYLHNVNSRELAIAASVNGARVGYVRSYSDMADAAAKLDDVLANATEGEYTASTSVSFDFAYTNDPVYLSEDECFDILWSHVEDDFCMAYMLYVDGRQAAAYGDKAELDALISIIEDELMNVVPAGFSNVQISNRIRIEKQICLKSEVKSLDEIDALLNPLSDEQKQSERDDDIITARVASIDASAPALSDTDKGDFMLDYNFINTVTVTEVIPFKTETVNDPELYVGTEVIEAEGINGAKNVTYELVYDTDGKLVKKSAVSQVIISEAVPQTIRVGTAEIPDAVPTGVILWPCERPKGVSSYYGWRDLYGKPDFHLGIDIPDVRGSVIWAADGGTVTFAGCTPSYGNNILIEHTNGFSTLYAHLETIGVKKGDKLYQGQHIGTMGATGVAYGNHLHFEVRINNKTVDPMKYLPEE